MMQQTTNGKPARPALRYHGGKWRLAPWIIAQFPPHICYVEPFGGGGSVLLSKPPSYLEVYNDLDSEVVNFFRILRERPAEFIRAITLTPFARSELRLAYEPTADDFERARRFYIRSWQGYGGPCAQWKTGWRFQVQASRGQRSIDDWHDVERLRAVVERLRLVQIECDEALTVIRHYDAPTTLFYLDPPYPAGTRSAKWSRRAYAHEMADSDHRHLAEVLHEIQGMAIISSYQSPLYDELYRGWAQVSKNSQTDRATTAVEHLWISPAALQAGMPLFSLPLSADQVGVTE
jgi:DNA adenine methylase